MNENTKDKEIIKGIMSAGIVAPPSEDFNEKIMNKIISNSMILQYNKFQAINIKRLIIITLAIITILLDLILVGNYYFQLFEVNKITLFISQILISLYSSPIVIFLLISICILILFNQFLSNKFKLYKNYILN